MEFFKKPANKRMRLTRDIDQANDDIRNIEVITLDADEEHVAPQGSISAEASIGDVITIDDSDDELITIEDSDDEEVVSNDESVLPQASADVIDQHGAGESFERIAEMTWSQQRIKRNGRFVNVLVRDLTFPRLGELSEPLHVGMPRLFNKFLDHCLEASGVSDKQNAKFCLTISHPSLDKGSIFMNFRKRAQLDGVAILNSISKAQQSKREVLLGADLHMEMYVFEEAVQASVNLLSGRGAVKFYFDADLKIPGTVRNTDAYCLPRSLAVGMLKADEETASTPDEKARLNRRRMNYLARSTPALHLKLLEEVQVAIDSPAYDLSTLELIAARHPEYMVVLFTRPPGQKMYSIYRIFNDGALKVVNLGYHNGHYDVLTPYVGRGVFAAVVCRMCKLVTRSADHRCKAKCTKCHEARCDAAIASTTQTILCEACNVSFNTRECFDRHMPDVCRKFKACRHCNRYHRVKATRPHNCETRFCTTCKQHAAADHSCCWMPPTDSQKKKKQEKQEKFKIVFYDFETVVLKNGRDLSLYADEQWPNLVAYSRFCNECLNSTEDCDVCQIKNGHYQYQCGDTLWSVTDRFLDWILNDPANNDTLFIAHNGSRFDMHFLVSRLIAKGVYPEMILNGTQLVRMSVKPLKGQKINTVEFKDSYLLVPLALSGLPKAFDVPDISKGEFPYLFNHPINYGVTLPTLPDKAYYCTARKKADAMTAFNNWYEANKNNSFNFDKEILDYCLMDVRILAECMKKYMVLATMTTGWNPLVHCCTFGSFSLLQLKMNHLKPNQVGILPESGYYSGQKQSKLASQYIRWLEHTLTRPLVHKLNGGEKEVEVASGQKFLLDAYDPAENQAYEINGCYYHGCPACTDGRAKSANTGLTMEEVYNRTVERKALIEQTGVRVTMIWEHEIYTALRENADMRLFFKRNGVVTRLVPREAFLGGRTQTYKLLAKATDRYSLEYVDFCSLYPYVTAFVAEYPIGTPVVITDAFESFEASCPYKGLIKCDVLPPRNLRYPVVGARINNKLVFTNCRTCAVESENIACTHSDIEERLIHTTITHVELECAIQRGYKVLKVYEVWAWQKWEKDGLFKDFVKKYIKIKQEASGWPKANMSEAEKADFLREHEAHVGVALDPAAIKKNPAMRSIAKLQLNSVWGKMGQRPDKIETKILAADDEELGRIINDPKKELTGFKIVDGVALCSWRPEDSYVRATAYTNVAIAAYTTAHARLLLYKAMEKIGESLVYTDTDSLIYLRDVNQPDPVADMRGDWLGMLTSEIPEGWKMTEFASPAAKVYSYILKNAAGETKVISKAKGVTLDHTAAEVVNYEGMERIVRSYVEEQVAEVLEVGTTLLKRSLGSVTTLDLNKKTSVVMDKLRYLPDYSTLPYGFL